MLPEGIERFDVSTIRQGCKARDTHVYADDGAYTVTLTLTADPYIKGVNPKPPKAATVIALLGINFGAEQADSTVNIYKPDGTTVITRLAADSTRIRLWSDAKVRFKMPGKPGRRQQMPRTTRSIGTPAWLAR